MSGLTLDVYNATNVTYLGTLSQVLAFKVGDTLMLNATPDSDISVRCGSIPVTTGKMGRKGQHIAVRVEAPINIDAAARLTGGKR